MAPYTPNRPLPEPPTQATLAEARRELTTKQQSVQTLSDRIRAAEEELARTVAIAKGGIHELEKERDELQEQVAHTLAYVAPIRRLPHELLRYIFLLNFEEYPCCAWVLSAVSSDVHGTVHSISSIIGVRRVDLIHNGGRHP
ncbi:hypothetical protein EVJ58_g5844 [Rhodofomes roseus]|uniref:Uncharacterized protein n=1 Tax=Rhodofomes roseus TaxID=34475 RepID=A0A4Y9YCZ9_9APHY|nr:hypothetical protein EVJ58_g5844 [Rhodofomes roseus]